MHDAILEYFAGEKNAAIMAMLVGMSGLAAAFVFFQPRWELRSCAIVLGIMGLLELSVGLGLFLKTGPQVDRLVAGIAADAPRAVADESARMVIVQRNFQRLEYFWIALIAAAAFVAATQKGRPALWGVSLGILLNASFMLVFDLVAERRGALYLNALTHKPGV
jgi:hypothetical protein